MSVSIGDIDKARGFYEGVLGLAELERPDLGRPGLWFGCGTGELHLSVQADLRGGRTGMPLDPTDRPGRAGGHVAFIMSGTLDDIARHLEAAAVPYARGRTDLPQIFCEDPAGNLVELNTGWPPRSLLSGGTA